MGDITSGVVRAATLKQAAECAGPQQQQQDAAYLRQLTDLHGVSRGLWQTAWDAHLPVNDGKVLSCQNIHLHFLGMLLFTRKLVVPDYLLVVHS